MKIFMKFLYAIAIIALFLIFFDSGRSARDKKYFKDVVLAEKGENNLENNKKEPFIGRLFAKNNLMYKQEKIGSVIYNDNIDINGEIKNISINFDIYQTLGFYIDETNVINYNGILNEFLVDGIVQDIVIAGYYNRPISYDNNFMRYILKDRDFPIFGLNSLVTSSELNPLESVIFEYNKVELLELVFVKSYSNKDLIETVNFTQLENYSDDNVNMYADVTSILRSKTGRFEYPNDEELLVLNELGINYHIFEGFEKYNYFIYIYSSAAIILASLSIYFVYIGPYLKKRKNTK